MPIEHISDTARWVAVYRAMESERPDAIFRDPFARRLAGAKGEEIVNTLKRGRAAAWSMIVRTAVFDEVIMARVQEGADLVVNLAAGLDARPWRLPLPPTLRWVDVDLPDILRYKTDTLSADKPVCRYEAIHADLTNDTVRQSVLSTLGDGAKNALVVTEGLLIYLTTPQVSSLAAALHAQRGFRWWMIDIASPRLLKMMNRSWGKRLESANAPFQFAPAEGTAYFKPLGWNEVEFHSTWEDSFRLNRTMRGAWLWNFISKMSSAKRREEGKRFAGNVLLERA